MKKQNIFLIATFIICAIALAACGGGSTGVAAKRIADKKISDDLTVTLSNNDGKLKNGKQEIVLAFTDGAGKPAAITAASLNFKMPAMGSMSEMNAPATLKTTGTPGTFTGSVNIGMAGEWIAQISYEGKDSGKTTITTSAY